MFTINENEVKKTIAEFENRYSALCEEEIIFLDYLKDEKSVKRNIEKRAFFIEKFTEFLKLMNQNVNFKDFVVEESYYPFTTQSVEIMGKMPFINHSIISIIDKCELIERKTKDANERKLIEMLETKYSNIFSIKEVSYDMSICNDINHQHEHLHSVILEPKNFENDFRYFFKIDLHKSRDIFNPFLLKTINDHFKTILNM